MKQTVSTVFNDIDRTNDITVIKTVLNGKDVYRKRCNTDEVDTKELIARIQKTSAGANALSLQFAYSLLKKEILNALEKGESVNVLDIGTFYPSVKSKWNGSSFEDTNDQTFTVKCRVLSTAKEAVKNLLVKNITPPKNNVAITSIVDTFTGRKDFVASEGKSICIYGKNIKLGSDKDSNIFFAPLDSNKNLKDESEWKKVQTVIKNIPTQIECYIPSDVKKGEKYKIVLRTHYLNCGKISKTTKETQSAIITII